MWSDSLSSAYRAAMAVFAFGQPALVCLVAGLTGRWWPGLVLWAVLALAAQENALFLLVSSPLMWGAVVWLWLRREPGGRLDPGTRAAAVLLALAGVVAAAAALFLLGR